MLGDHLLGDCFVVQLLAGVTHELEVWWDVAGVTHVVRRLDRLTAWP